MLNLLPVFYFIALAFLLLNFYHLQRIWALEKEIYSIKSENQVLFKEISLLKRS